MNAHPRLPNQSYLDFPARALAEAGLAYVNPDIEMLDGSCLLEQYALMIPDADPAPPSYLQTHAILEAERYGGGTIGVHGGGVRCGNRGGLSVKGIGCNPLAGDGSPDDYSHGGLALSEALQEALWGEVFQIALPFGAVRSHAAISTASMCWWVERRWGKELLRDRYGEDVYIPRGLLVREMAVRPAHFERALFYRPRPETPYTRDDDVERVREATRQISRHLPQLAGHEATSDARDIQTGLAEMARRFALQSAAAKANRFVHGNICSSNICLDGRWIDFGSVTAVPNWGTLGGYGHFWKDASVYEAIFRLVVRTISQHVSGARAGLPEPERLLDIYLSTLESSLETRFLAMAGVPVLANGAHVANPWREDLVRCMRRAASAGHSLPFDGHPTENSDFGHLRLNVLLNDVVSADGGAVPLSVNASAAPIAKDLVETYRRYLAHLQASADGSVSPVNLHRFLLLATGKLRGDALALYKPNLVNLAERWVSEHREPDDLRQVVAGEFDRILSEVSYRYTVDEGFRVRIGRVGGDALFYDAEADDLILGGLSAACVSRVPRDSIQGRRWVDALAPIADDQRRAWLFDREDGRGPRSPN